MPKKRKRAKASLPRLTVLALSSRELLRFMESVEKVSTLANDLKVIADQLERATSKRRKSPETPAEGT
jgi:hypothetical protein